MIIALGIVLLFIIIIFMAEGIAQKNEETKVKSSPKDVFMHLLMIVMLYASTISFISLWFDYINNLFPDKLNYYYQAVLEGVLIATATLFVAFPVFLLASWLIGRDEKKDPIKHELRVRQWLIYLTLFVSAIAIIVDVVRLVYDFLSGELTLPFFLKIFVVLVVAGFAFGYYLWDVKRTADVSTKVPKIFTWITSAIVLASIILGFFLFGTPAHQRSVRFDSQRVSDLQMIQSEVVSYWQQKEALPTQVSDLTNNISGFFAPLDPNTGIGYEYTVKGPLSFEICATFEAKSINNNTSPEGRNYVSKPVSGGYALGDAYNQNWDHEIGRKCYERTIDPAIYKINKPLPVIIQEGKVPTAVPVQ
jgi:cytochrome c biogenesis protein CcdA